MLERSKKTQEAEKRNEPGEVTLEDLERELKANRTIIEQRAAEINAKVEKLRKQIEGQTPPAPASH